MRSPPEQSVSPLCRLCGYSLVGIESPGKCPECARPFDRNDPRTFDAALDDRARVPAWPTAALALVGVAGVFAISVYGRQSWGWSIWIVPPVALGAMLGYAIRAPAWTVRHNALMLIVLVALMTFMGFGGLFCFAVLLVITALPAAVGWVLGRWLRSQLRRADGGRPPRYPCWILLAAAQGVILLEGRPQPCPPETVRTSASIAAPRDRTWAATMFYEEVRHPAPLVLRVGLARPLKTLGESERVGDVKTCIYNKGYISKKTTAVIPGEQLAFDVIGQQIGYEHDVRLISGAFEFKPEGQDRTRVTLSTTYEPLLHPRWAWRPFERFAVHTLHGHVLEGMRLEATVELAHPATEAPVAVGAAR